MQDHVAVICIWVIFLGLIILAYRAGIKALPPPAEMNEKEGHRFNLRPLVLREPPYDWEVKCPDLIDTKN